MSTLNEYLGQKRTALLARRAKVEAGESSVSEFKAHVAAEGRSGIRHIQIRQHHVISDSKYDFAGYDLGPGSPELQLGVLGSCLTHIFLIQAADKQVPLDSLEVDVQGQLDSNAGRPGYENVPVYPHNISYTVSVKSSASDAVLADLYEAVERACPILNLLINPQEIQGTLVRKAATEKGKPRSIASYSNGRTGTGTSIKVANANGTNSKHIVKAVSKSNGSTKTAVRTKAS